MTLTWDGLRFVPVKRTSSHDNRCELDDVFLTCRCSERATSNVAR